VTSVAARQFRLVQWALRPDQDDDAPPLMYAFRCLTLRDDDSECGARSETSTDPVDPQDWAFAHMREYPEHTSYAEVIERPYVMWREGST
jgi:hypothetical protein